MFDSLKFWKKKDEFDFNLDLEPANPGQSEKEPFFKDPTGFNPQNPNENMQNPFQQSPDPSSPFQMQSFQDKAKLDSNHNPSNQVSSRDIELLSSKLDTVKAMLENVIQRLDKIDRENNLEKPKIEQRRW